MGLLKIMRENRAKADEQERAAMQAEADAALFARMDEVHEIIMSIPLGTEPAPSELLAKYTDEAIERIRAASGTAPGDPLLEASGLQRRREDRG